MSRRVSGWISSRSQIAFLVGLVIASGVIFWLEKVRFEQSDDPLGSYWIHETAQPPARLPDAGALTLVAQWRPILAARLAAGDPEGAPAPLLLAYATCLQAGDPCAELLQPAAQAALAAVAASSDWPDPLDPALALVALATLERQAVAPDPRPAYRTLARWLDGFDEADLAGRFGIAQFFARAAALTGHEFAGFRSYASLRPIFESADGLTRLGVPASGELVLGLALLLESFPRAPIANLLLWRACLDWPGGLGEAPAAVALHCWSRFSAPEIDAAVTPTLRAVDPASLTARDAALALLALTALEQGPLLAGR